ncbi:FAST kinase domain-containing protein 3, mitochondrial isoform X1 [Zootermopsis nevadensis]|uniref:FAST kinase domain-containing protein 3, mitochondrial isoform X1 n=1 Tax=Zootermopsis nevadensis TaxID=136037 RepID=UPI000B8EE003|nr:FAST kinase domain-containing protein 3, mitochondrial isoform X1 [Zootermopsis nevadensis]
MFKMSRSIVKQVFYTGGKVLFYDTSPLSMVWGNLTVSCLSKSEAVSKCGKRDDLGQTTIIMQDGLDIQELPAIVRKVKDVGLVSLQNCLSSTNSDYAKNEGRICSHTPNISKERNENSENVTHVDNDTETTEIIEGFNRCFTTKGLFLLLETIPDEEVIPLVAFYALKKLIELENNYEYRNASVRNGEEFTENFTRTAVFSRLINTIASGSESTIILDTLKVLSREMFGSNSSMYRDKLCDEILVRVTDGKFDVVQVCEIVRMLASFMDAKNNAENVDKLWVGLLDKEKEITEKNIMEVFRILPILKQSRKMVFSLLERKSRVVWWRLHGSAVAEILSIILEVKLFSPQMMVILSRWTNTNIHAVSEDDLLEIVRGFCALDYVDSGIAKALERYVKAKSSKVKNAAVLAAIMDYCGRFRLRSEPILKGCEGYIIEHGQNLSPVTIKAMFAPFGILNFQPSDSLKFWYALESILDEKFVQFRPEDAIDVLLTCVYLGKFPLNFVQKIFNPYFLDRLHSYRDVNILRQLRAKLKLFDTAMTLECSQYRGPMLPRDHSANSLWQDGRIHRMINYISEPLADITGGIEMLTTSVVLPHLPTLELYVIDIMLHPSGMGGSTIRFNLRHDCKVYVAVLIHVPEHYCAGGTELIGPQLMRKRHFRRLGMKVAELQYDKLTKLRVHPRTLQEYLIERLKSAEDAM